MGTPVHTTQNEAPAPAASCSQRNMGDNFARDLRTEEAEPLKTRLQSLSPKAEHTRTLVTRRSLEPVLNDAKTFISSPKVGSGAE